MRATPDAQQFLRELGIVDPQEINLEAIAWTLGCQIRQRRLDGCEARIIGTHDRAIITVDTGGSRRRQRFSIAHELGHWIHHRGRVLICRSEDIGSWREGQPIVEHVADRFAAELLMPTYIFDPIARKTQRFDLESIRKIAELFDTSLTATAIRLLERKHCIAILVCHGRAGRKWFYRSPYVSSRWFPAKNLDSDSFAFDVLFGSTADSQESHKVSADTWFEHPSARDHEITEQTIKIGDDEILTLLTIDDEEMLEEIDTHRVPHR